MGNHSDPDIDFAEVFAMDGLSTSYAIRNIFGLFYTQELFEFLRTPPPDVWNRVQRSQAIGRWDSSPVFAASHRARR